jgi:hypothetical protein
MTTNTVSGNKYRTTNTVSVFQNRMGQIYTVRMYSTYSIRLQCHYYATTMPLLCHLRLIMPLNSQKGSYYATHYASIVWAKLFQAYAGRIAKWQGCRCQLLRKPLQCCTIRLEAGVGSLDRSQTLWGRDAP